MLTFNVCKSKRRANSSVPSSFGTSVAVDFNECRSQPVKRLIENRSNAESLRAFFITGWGPTDRNILLGGHAAFEATRAPQNLLLAALTLAACCPSGGECQAPR